MKIAFYAPLKSPDSPVPSGDRLIGRMLRQALIAGGHEVRIASKLRAFDRDGDPARQQRLARLGDWQQAHIVRHVETSGWRPNLWLTYHLYHKAPDWIGPPVARALGIPYCVAEASSSPRQRDGKWAQGHGAVADALGQAALVININPKDEAGIRPLIGPQTRMVTMAPFVDGTALRAAAARRAEHRAALAASLGLDAAEPWLLAVGMLRAGDKAESYEVLACAASMLADRPWQLIVIGDGVARGEIERKFAGLAKRVRFVGQQPGEVVAEFMAAADVLVWPAVNEAIGMVFIEAAMAGLPVVGANRPGIAAVVADGETGLLVPERDVVAFAGATARLLDDANWRRQMGDAAARRAVSQNDLGSAGMLFCRELEKVM
ncbi:MAG: glycosyltransferase family 4 protein [Hyphomicrobiaceae bacterium]